MTENELLIRLEYEKKRNEILGELLKRALPFVETHWQLSRSTFGKSAQALMNEIKAVLGVR